MSSAQQSAKSVQSIVRNVGQHWVGDGFPVRSLFSYGGGNRFDPFLLLDYAGPMRFQPAQAKRGVGEHPHRGFETVTIVYQGELEHRDSSGSHGSIGPGDVQWMTAASGVVHEEFHSERFTREGGDFEVVQLWVNLPSAVKMSPPRYQSLSSSQIPQVDLPGGRGSVRVIAGAFAQTSGAASTFSPINVWDMQITGPVEFDVPSGHTALVVVQAGTIELAGHTLGKAELAEFERAGTTIRLNAPEPARLLVLTGEPIGEPIVGQGPFVMNTREEIIEAIHDYQAGRMGRLD